MAVVEAPLQMAVVGALGGGSRVRQNKLLQHILAYPFVKLYNLPSKCTQELTWHNSCPAPDMSHGPVLLQK